MNPGIGDIQRKVAVRFGLPREAILGLNRERRVARPRQIAMALAREMTGLSLPGIARHFARDHTTVLHACRRIAALSAADPDFARMVQSCRELILHLPPSVSHAGKPAKTHLPPSAASPHGGRNPGTAS
jgi:chromosomal replication initiator protein